jgi:hypothetical protein
MNETQPAATAEAPRQLHSLRGGHAPEANLPAVTPGFGSLQAYELLVRQAKGLSSSTLVPPQYRQVIVKYNRDGSIKSTEDNANAIPNCMIALNMAARMGADPLMVMQNLVVIEGRPSWSAQWVIAQINQCGRFEPLRFDLVEKGKQTVTMEYTEWGERKGERVRKTRDVEVENIECIAWTVRKGTIIPPGVETLEQARAAKLSIIKGPKVSVAMAVQEGWYTKTGSKWVTMPELMLHYRSGAFFGRLYAPELLMGIPTDDEVRDMGTLVQGADGSYGPAGASEAMPTVEALRATATAHAEAGQDPGPPDAATTEGSPVVTPATGDATVVDPATSQPTGAGAKTEGDKPPSEQLFGNTD